MRPSSLYLALGAAQLAACAPTTTPVVLADHLKKLSAHTTSPSSHDHASTSSITTYWIPDGDRGDPSSPHPGRRPPPRNNPHRAPHSELPPPPPSPPSSSLSKHHRDGDERHERAGGRRRTGWGPRRGHRKVDLVPLRITVDGGEGKDDGETQVVDLGVPSDWLSSAKGKSGSPYPPPRHGRLSSSAAAGTVGTGAGVEWNDMLVVLLVAAFVVFVVLMETWESLFRRQGAIRLDDTSGQLPLLPVSVRAVPRGNDDPGDGKRRA